MATGRPCIVFRVARVILIGCAVQILLFAAGCGGGGGGGGGGGDRQPTGNPPTISGTSFNGTEDEQLSGRLALSDPEGGELTVTVTRQVDHGVLTGPDASGAFTYAPAANFNGTDSFMVLVQDAQSLSTSTTVTIAIAPVSDAPTPVSDTVAVAAGRTSTIAILRNDPDVDGEALQPQILTYPDNGMAQLQSDGTILFTPSPGFTGQTRFQYRLVDSDGGESSPALVLVEVFPPLDDDGGKPVDPDVLAACTPSVTLDLGDTDPQLSQQFMNAVDNDVEGFVQKIGRGVCSLLYRSVEEVRPVTHITLRVTLAYDFMALAGTNPDGEAIVILSSFYLGKAHDDGADLAYWVKGLFYHELTHVYQHDDGDHQDSETDIGLPGMIEGIAEYVRLLAGYPADGSRADQNGQWNDGYSTTAFFLLWLDRTYPDCVYRLNLSMDERDGRTWTRKAFEDITGKTVDTLWEEYRATFN